MLPYLYSIHLIPVYFENISTEYQEKIKGGFANVLSLFWGQAQKHLRPPNRLIADCGEHEEQQQIFQTQEILLPDF
jgi:hypothetical protein